MTSTHDPVVIDDQMRDVHGQCRRLRETGALTPVELPGPVRAWAVTRYETLQTVLGHPALSKELRHWSAWARGDVPADWPLNNIVTARSMVTAEGPDHQRLRGLVSRAFTPRHIADLRPRVHRLAHELLDQLADHAPGPVDLRRQYAYPLPRNVVCELVGMPRAWRAELGKLAESLVRITDDQSYADARMHDLHELFGEVIALRRREPGDDLTSALIAVSDEDGDRLSEAELHGMVMTLFVAGHETTINLITNAIRALLTHPGQLDRARSGEVPWSAVVEETLRWDSPVAYFPMRYAVEDVDIDGVLVRQGEAVLACYAAVGRDPDRYGDRAARFEPSEPPATHLSFGHGTHFCLGASLARLEAEVALEALFERYPGLTPAEPVDRLRPLATVLSNSIRSLPVTMTPPAEGTGR
ncbi:cytochrome P450 family protein [Nonomuraea antri]|uniref:cytochrome P450 family protein n=1 Tax=Nonomuraea antri TaxID=2730852 RepID=UPI002E2A7BE4|nr:cytochrome P450 [Nonomuraea antri]